MIVSNAAVQQFLDRIRAFNVAMAASADRNALIAGRAMDRLSKDLVALIAADTAPTGVAIDSPEAFDALMRRADAIVAQYEASLGDHYRTAFREQMVGLRDQLPGAYASFGRTTVDRIIGAREVFREKARGELFEAGFEDWMTEFRSINSRLVKDMRESVAMAVDGGWDRRRLANELLSRGSFTYDNLPRLTERGVSLFNAGGRLGENDALIRRAYLNARTKLTAARNAANVVWSQAVGYDHFLNVNLDPVSKECRAATEAGPMSTDEWHAWSLRTGFPMRAPRHPGCDSDMVAVPANAVRGVREVTDAELEAALNDLEQGRRRDGSSVRSAA